MDSKSPEASSITAVDPNDWDLKESIFEFIHREIRRLSGKIPAEFEATGFRISFVATTDKLEYPVNCYFTAAMRVLDIGEVKSKGRNPSEATIGLINFVYEQYARKLQRESERQRSELARHEAETRQRTAYRSLFNYEPQEIADMVDNLVPLPEGVTFEMAVERSRKIAIETVRELNDSELEHASPPAFLSEDERQSFRVRCESEIRCRSRVRQVYEAHQHLWPQRNDAYSSLLQIWKLCNRQAAVLDDVIKDFFYSDTKLTSARTLESLLSIAPERITKTRRDKANARREAERPQREEREAEYRRRQAEYLASREHEDWSKTAAPI